MDVIKQLGELALASRMKRLADRFTQDVALIYKDLSIDYEPRWFAVYYVLSQKAPLSIVDIANALGISHPCVNQIAGEMIRRGVVSELKDKNDKRKRLLTLTPHGKALLPQLQPIWEDIDLAAREVVHATGFDILAAMERLENALDSQNFYSRIRQQMKNRQMALIEIIDYDPRYAPDFKALNLAWIEKYFAVEERDAHMLDHPGQIIGNSGNILFARLEGQIVGTCAVIREDAETYELAKMAVYENARGKQIGKRLLQAAIQWAQSQGARQMVLGTNSKLTPAIQLYRQFGFVLMPSLLAQYRQYDRVDMVMQLDLAPSRVEALVR